MKVILKLFSLKLIGSILAVLYSILQVRYFGATRGIEIYFAAQSLVYLVSSLSQGGQLAEIFLPEYLNLNQIRSNLGFSALNVVINRMLFFGGAIILIIFFTAPLLIKLMIPGFSPEDQSLAVLMFRVLLPYLFLQLMNSFFITVLNAEEKYGRAEFLGFINTLINIIVLVLLFAKIGVWALVVSLLAGKLIEFLFYLIQLYRLGYRYSLILRVEEFDHNSFFKTMRNTIFYVGATQVYSMVLTASISFLPEGIYAVFKYVQNLANKLKGLLIQPFITVFFTEFALKIEDTAVSYTNFRKFLLSIINVNCITIIGTILFGDYVIELLWGSDKFGLREIKLSYIFLMFNVLAILISSVGIIYRKMAIAHGLGRKLYVFWTFSQLISALVSYLLIRYFAIDGLFFILPINALLIATSSYFVYSNAIDSLKYPFFDRIHLILVSLIAGAYLLRNWINNLSINNDFSKIVILIGVGFLLAMYPLNYIYQLLKTKNDFTKPHK